MRIVLSSEQLHILIPGYPDDVGYVANLDDQGKLAIWTQTGDSVPVAVACWNPEHRAIEARSGQVHADPVISDKVYEIFTGVLTDLDKSKAAKISQILASLSRHGFPAVTDDDLQEYLAKFPEPVRGLLASGMSALFVDDAETADRAFQQAARFARYGRTVDSARFDTNDGSPNDLDTLKIRHRARGEGMSVRLDVSSRRYGDLRFEGANNNPASTIINFHIQENTTETPIGKFTLLGTRLPAGRFDVEFIDPGDKITSWIRPTPHGEYHLVLTGEVVHTELEDRTKLNIHVCHPFGRWTGRIVSVRERATIRYLKDLLVQLTEDADLNGGLVSVTDAANVPLGIFRAHRIPAFSLVNRLLVEHELYGTFEREGTFSVRTLREEDQAFWSTPPHLLYPRHVTQTKGSPLPHTGPVSTSHSAAATNLDPERIPSMLLARSFTVRNGNQRIEWSVSVRNVGRCGFKIKQVVWHARLPDAPPWVVEEKDIRPERPIFLDPGSTQIFKFHMTQPEAFVHTRYASTSLIELESQFQVSVMVHAVSMPYMIEKIEVLAVQGEFIEDARPTAATTRA